VGGLCTSAMKGGVGKLTFTMALQEPAATPPGTSVDRQWPSITPTRRPLRFWRRLNRILSSAPTPTLLGHGGEHAAMEDRCDQLTK